jgi:DNA-binding NarL/FixJ family response regulator
VRVLIVADDPAVRAAVASSLSGQPGVTAVDQTPLDGDLAAAAAPYRPDVIVWDLGGATGGIVPQLSAMFDLAAPVIVLGDY